MCRSRGWGVSEKEKVAFKGRKTGDILKIPVSAYMAQQEETNSTESQERGP